MNRIEEFWIRIDDRSKASSDTSKQVLNAIALKVTGILNRIVGTKIVSVRLIGISSCFSFVSLFVFYGLFFELIAYVVIKYGDQIKQRATNWSTVEHAVPLFMAVGFVLFAFSVAFALLAILPIVFRPGIFAWLSCLPTAVVGFGFYRLVCLHQLNQGNAFLFAALALSICSDVALLVVIRMILKWMLERTDLPRIIITLGSQLLLFAVIFILPIVYLERWGTAVPSSAGAVGSLTLTVFNIPTALASLLFLFLLAIVLLHRITWPLLSDWVYILNRKDVLDKRKTIRAISLVLIVYGLSGIAGASALLKLAEKVAK